MREQVRDKMPKGPVNQREREIFQPLTIEREVFRNNIR